jgi:hypothetical protein
MAKILKSFMNHSLNFQKIFKMSKKKSLKNLGKIKGLSIQFMPYSEIRDLNSANRIKKILNLVLSNNILIIQGKLKADEESRLIEDTMAMIGHIKNFKGIELAVISENNNRGIFNKLRKSIIKILSKGEIGAITIVGPATIVKEIKQNPKKIELLLNR